ncbi:MAG: hypothetical protein JRG77_07520 [Deltaproteobacteria bacterium]|nr:hypothetical protein [Deltaproteobacteria bacterium]
MPSACALRQGKIHYPVFPPYFLGLPHLTMTPGIFRALPSEDEIRITGGRQTADASAPYEIALAFG